MVLPSFTIRQLHSLQLSVQKPHSIQINQSQDVHIMCLHKSPLSESVLHLLPKNFSMHTNVSHLFKVATQCAELRDLLEQHKIPSICSVPLKLTSRWKQQSPRSSASIVFLIPLGRFIHALSITKCSPLLFSSPLHHLLLQHQSA